MASVPSQDSLHIEGNTQVYSSKAETSQASLHTISGTAKPTNSHQEHRHHHPTHNLNKERPLNPLVTPTKNHHIPSAESSFNSNKDKFKALSPINATDDLYRESYYSVLDQGGSFKRQSGMFTDFSVKNKVTIAQMKHDRSPKRDHNRYMSKPVLFTALETKNKLSESVALSHTQLLANRPTKYLNTQAETDEIVLNTSITKSRKIDALSLTSPRTNKSREPSINLPQIHSVKNSKNNTIISPYGLKASIKSYSPEKSHDLSIRTPTLDLNVPEFHNINLNESKMLSSLTGKSISKYFGENYSILDNIRRATSEKLPLETSKYEKEQIPRYRTKKMTDNIFKKFYENSQLDGEKYLEGTTDTVYKMNSSIALSKLENEKSLVRKNPTNPIAYIPQSDTLVYQEPTTKDQISKFDENLLGWAKSIPNFGKQRWTYDPHWKFGLI